MKILPTALLPHLHWTMQQMAIRSCLVVGVDSQLLQFHLLNCILSLQNTDVILRMLDGFCCCFVFPKPLHRELSATVFCKLLAVLTEEACNVPKWFSPDILTRSLQFDSAFAFKSQSLWC